MDTPHKESEFADLSAAVTSRKKCQSKRISFFGKNRKKGNTSGRSLKWSSLYKKCRTVGNKENEEIFEDNDSRDAMELLEDIWSSTNASLEYKAKKSNLSTRNVKTIIKHVISNEGVIQMVRNTLLAEAGSKPNLEEAEYLPRLTRSKVKDLQGASQFPQAGDSPVKLKDGSVTSVRLLMNKFDNKKRTSHEEDEPEDMISHNDSVSLTNQSHNVTLPVDVLLGEELPENESSSDNEYEPVEEAEYESEKEEEDDNSVLLPSMVHDAGSLPLSSREHSPHSLVPSDIDRESALVIPEPSLNNADVSNNQVPEIALRTRSKLPLDDTPLEVIEAAFVAPDISVDMYDTECNDPEWLQFLQDLTKPIGSAVEAELDEPNGDENDGSDPDYNFLEEEANMPDEEVKIDKKWDNRDDKAVKIPQKEVRELLKELEEIPEPIFFHSQDEQLSGDDDDDDERNEESLVEDVAWSPSTDQYFYPENFFQLLAQSMTPEEKMQLQEQMRMHVQLLCQTYVLTIARPMYREHGCCARDMLYELSSFSSHVVPDGNESFFKAHNLQGALKIVHSEESNNRAREWHGRVAERGFVVGPDDVKKILAFNKTFIYPDLLPRSGFQTDIHKKWKLFIPPESNLIALGLEQLSSFKPITRKYSMISALLLPAKTAQQILNHIYHSRSVKDNPIHYYFKHKKAPPFPRSIRPFDPNDVKIPANHPPNVLPKWLVTYVKKCCQSWKRARERRKQIQPPARKAEPTIICFLNPVQNLQNCPPTDKAPNQQYLVINMDAQKSNSDTLVKLQPKPAQCLTESIEKEKQHSQHSSSLRRSPRKISKELDFHRQPSHSNGRSDIDEPPPKRSTHSMQTRSQKLSNVIKKKDLQSKKKLSVKCRKRRVAKNEDLDHGSESSLSGNSEPLPKKLRSMPQQSKKLSNSSRQKGVQKSDQLCTGHSRKSIPDDATKPTDENTNELADTYVIEVVNALKDEPKKLEKFLLTLASFEEDSESYDNLYEEVKGILSEYPALLKRFSLFKPENTKDG